MYLLYLCIVHRVVVVLRGLDPCCARRIDRLTPTTPPHNPPPHQNRHRPSALVADGARRPRPSPARRRVLRPDTVRTSSTLLGTSPPALNSPTHNPTPLKHSYTVLLAKLLPTPSTSIATPLLDWVREDRYYCLLLPWTLPPTVVLIYLNWLGLEFYRTN